MLYSLCVTSLLLLLLPDSLLLPPTDTPAQTCFRRAGDEPNAKLCRAELLVMEARRSHDAAAAQQRYLQACRLYKDIGR
jgi:hypothetical protein